MLNKHEENDSYPQKKPEQREHKKAPEENAAKTHGPAFPGFRLSPPMFMGLPLISGVGAGGGGGGNT